MANRVCASVNSRILLIHNPVAGRRRQKRLLRLTGLLEMQGHHVQSHLTTRPGDAAVAACQARGCDFIIAAGGDGTVNEIINGLYTRDDAGQWPAIGFLPMGTANVLAWELGLPQAPEALARLIEAGRTLAVRPGNANGRRFFLMASAGLDARAVACVDAKTKRLLGAAAYVLAACKALTMPSPVLSVGVDGRKDTAQTVIVTRARRYGGPFVLTPDAGLQTDRLHAVLLQSGGLVAALRYGLALALGRLHKLSDVQVLSGAEVRVEGPSEEPVQMDGDIISNLPLTVRMEDRAVRFLVP